MKHTQGPWKVEIHNSVTEVWNQNTYIASVRHDLFKTTEKSKQYESNARLIAAAPEMIELLIKVSSHIDEMYNLRNTDLDLQNEINLLIKKAKGV